MEPTTITLGIQSPLRSGLRGLSQWVKGDTLQHPSSRAKQLSSPNFGLRVRPPGVPLGSETWPRVPLPSPPGVHVKSRPQRARGQWEASYGGVSVSFFLSLSMGRPGGCAAGGQRIMPM